MVAVNQDSLALVRFTASTAEFAVNQNFVRFTATMNRTNHRV